MCGTVSCRRRIEIPHKTNGVGLGHCGFLIFAACLIALLLAPRLLAGNLSLPAEAVQALDKIYSDDPAAAMPIARGLQQSQPDHPLGYLLEAEALWWKRYCAARQRGCAGD